MAIEAEFLKNINVPLPLVRQSTDFSCGSACLRAILLYWFGEQPAWDREEYLWRHCKMGWDGSDMHHLAKAMREFGLTASAHKSMKTKTLLNELSAGKTIMIGIQAWLDDGVDPRKTWDDGHYVTLVGATKDDLIVMDPSIAFTYASIPLKELRARWRLITGGKRVRAPAIVSSTDNAPLGAIFQQLQQIK